MKSFIDSISVDLAKLRDAYCLPLISRRFQLVHRFPVESANNGQQLLLATDIESNALQFILLRDSWVDHMHRFEDDVVFNAVNSQVIRISMPEGYAPPLHEQHVSDHEGGLELISSELASFCEIIKESDMLNMPEVATEVPPASKHKCNDALKMTVDDGTSDDFFSAFDFSSAFDALGDGTLSNMFGESAKGGKLDTAKLTTLSVKIDLDSALPVSNDLFSLEGLMDQAVTALNMPPWEQCGLPRDIYTKAKLEFADSPKSIFIITDDAGFLVVYPEILVKCTTVGSAVSCARRELLIEAYSAFFATSTVSREDLIKSSTTRIAGCMSHEVIQDSMRSGLSNDQNALRVLMRVAQKRHHREFLCLPVETETKAKQIVLSSLDFFNEWSKENTSPLAARHSSASVKTQSDPSPVEDKPFIGDDDLALFADVNVLDVLKDIEADSSSRTLLSATTRPNWPENIPPYISHVVDIEENIRSVILGLKGRIDVTSVVALESLQHHAADTHGILNSLIRSLIVFPLELKSGTWMTESYRAQLMLYIMLLFERYRLPPDPLSNLDSALQITACNAANLPTDWAFGALLNARTQQYEKVRTKRFETIVLIQLRNEIALSLRILDMSPSKRHHLLQPLENIEENDCFEASESPQTHERLSRTLAVSGFPHVLKNPLECKNCYMSSRCMLIHRTLENGTYESFGGTYVMGAIAKNNRPKRGLASKPVSDSQEKWDDKIEGEAMWNMLVGFLKEHEIEFARKWLNLLDIEYNGGLMVKTNLLETSSSERKKQKMCADQLLLVGANPVKTLNLQHLFDDVRHEEAKLSEEILSKIAPSAFDYIFALNPASSTSDTESSNLGAPDIEDIVTNGEDDNALSSDLRGNGLRVGDYVLVTVHPNMNGNQQNESASLPLWRILQNEERSLLNERARRLNSEKGVSSAANPYRSEIGKSFFARIGGKIQEVSSEYITVRVSEGAGGYGPLSEFVCDIEPSKALIKKHQKKMYNEESAIQLKLIGSIEIDESDVVVARKKNHSMIISASSKSDDRDQKKEVREIQPKWHFCIDKEEDAVRVIRLLRDNILFLLEPDHTGVVSSVQVDGQLDSIEQSSLTKEQIQWLEEGLNNVDLTEVIPHSTSLSLDHEYEVPSRLRSLIVNKKPPTFSTWCKAASQQVKEVEGMPSAAAAHLPTEIGDQNSSGPKKRRIIEDDEFDAPAESGLEENTQRSRNALLISSEQKATNDNYTSDTESQTESETESEDFEGFADELLGIKRQRGTLVKLKREKSSEILTVEDCRRIFDALDQYGPLLLGSALHLTQSDISSSNQDKNLADEAVLCSVNDEGKVESGNERLNNENSCPSLAQNNKQGFGNYSIDELENISVDDVIRKFEFGMDDIPHLMATVKKLGMEMQEYNYVIAKNFLDLNAEQQSVIIHALNAKDYTLCLGYPGTGKTVTITVLIQILIALGMRVLLTSHTHAAVDNVMMKLMSYPSLSGRLLRVGELSRIHKEVMPCTFEGEYVQSESNPSLSSSDIMYEKFKTGTDFARAMSEKALIGCTCLGITKDVLTSQTFDFVIMDEAAQMTLPASLGPLRLLRPGGRFILVGDVNQLRPLVKSTVASSMGLEISLFEYLSTIDNERKRMFKDVVKGLTVPNDDRFRFQSCQVPLASQYRMNADILALANGLVYEGNLRCGSMEVAKSRMQTPNSKLIRHLGAQLAISESGEHTDNIISQSHILEDEGQNGSKQIDDEIILSVAEPLFTDIVESDVNRSQFDGERLETEDESKASPLSQRGSPRFGLSQTKSNRASNVICMAVAFTSWLGWVIDENRSVVMIDTSSVPRQLSQEVRPTKKPVRSSDGGVVSSLCNPFEAVVTMWTVAALLGAGLNARDIGIISPYKAQLDCLKSLLENELPKIDLFVEKCARICSLRKQPIDPLCFQKFCLDDLELHTVDRFQGRDKKCIILSMVRNNSSGNTGPLLQDRRRINVALTRARQKLIIVGHSLTLAGVCSTDNQPLSSNQIACELDKAFVKTHNSQSQDDREVEEKPLIMKEGVMKDCVEILREKRTIVALPSSTLSGSESKLTHHFKASNSYFTDPFVDWANECIATLESEI